MAVFKPQRKTSSGMEDLDIDAATLDGKDSSYYLNYNNLTNKPTISSTSGFLPKTTYEWNKEIAFSNTGKLCIGKFPMYDSNLTIEIKATTSKTYSATLIIATQNVKNTQLGTLTATVYGDPNNDVGKNIYIEHVSGNNMIGVYFSPEEWSKNLIHIQAVALNTNANYGSTAATDICTNVASIPTTATKQPTNALTSVIPTKTSQLTNDSGFKTTDTDTWRVISVNGKTIFGGATNTAGIDLTSGSNITIDATPGSPNVKISATDTTYTFENGTNSFTVTPKGGTAQTVTVTPSIANATTSKAGLMSSTDKTNLNTLSNLLGDDSDAVVNKINEVIEIFDSYPEGNKIVDALAGKQSKVAKLGSTSKPVYISAAGTFAAASTYAGGTKVTLNGTDKGASTATIYAPTAVGTSGQILKSNGSGAPTWVAQSDLTVGYASSAGSATAATTAKNATNDQLGNNIKDTYATKAELAKLPKTDTWRTISVNGKTIFGSATNTAGINLQAGSNVTINATPGSPNVTIDVKGGGGTSSFILIEDYVFSLESQRPMEIGLDGDLRNELFVYISTQDGTYELSDDFGNKVSCKKIAVMHLNYLSEDEMLLGTMTSDTGVSKPFISSNLSFFAESGDSITLNVIICGR